MDFSNDSVYGSIAALLTRSEKFIVWVEGANSPHNFTVLDGLIHAVDTATREHYVVRLTDAKISVESYVSRWGRSPAALVVELADPTSLTKLEEFFGVGSMDDPARPVDPVAAIAAIME